MNDAEIDAVVQALQRCVGTGLDQVWQPARDRVVLGLADGTLLLLVPRGPLPRLHPLRRRPKNPDRPFSFQGACRAHLRGPLTRLDKDPGDRVVRLWFGPARLELRLTGRSGGLWLVEGDRVVAAYDGPAPDALPELPDRPPRPDAPRFPTTPDAAEAARQWCEAREEERELRELRARVGAGLRRALNHDARLLEHLEEDLARADEAPALRHRADLLAAHLHAVPRGASRFAVDDWDGSGPVFLELDPGKPASATLERLYHKAGRLERVGERVLERMDQVEKQLASRRAQLEGLEELPLDTLRELDRTLPKSGAGARPSAPPDRPWVTWNGPHGERVRVGRNEKGNRRLTFQSARGTDWWMHLRGRPGAHLVMDVGRDRSPSLELLLAAAQIALIQGRVAPGEAAEVQYARVRDVRPIPGEVARVTIADEKVLRVVRDPQALGGWAREDADD